MTACRSMQTASRGPLARHEEGDETRRVATDGRAAVLGAQTGKHVSHRCAPPPPLSPPTEASKTGTRLTVAGPRSADLDGILDNPGALHSRQCKPVIEHWYKEYTYAQGRRHWIKLYRYSRAGYGHFQLFEKEQSKVLRSSIKVQQTTPNPCLIKFHFKGELQFSPRSRLWLGEG